MAMRLMVLRDALISVVSTRWRASQLALTASSIDHRHSRSDLSRTPHEGHSQALAVATLSRPQDGHL